MLKFAHLKTCAALVATLCILVVIGCGGSGTSKSTSKASAFRAFLITPTEDEKPEGAVLFQIDRKNLVIHAVTNLATALYASPVDESASDRIEFRGALLPTGSIGSLLATIGPDKYEKDLALSTPGNNVYKFDITKDDLDHTLPNLPEIMKEVLDALDGARATISVVNSSNETLASGPMGSFAKKATIPANSAIADPSTASATLTSDPLQEHLTVDVDIPMIPGTTARDASLVVEDTVGIPLGTFSQHNGIKFKKTIGQEISTIPLPADAYTTFVLLTRVGEGFLSVGYTIDSDSTQTVHHFAVFFKDNL
jgi:hypothetical protein